MSNSYAVESGIAPMAPDAAASAQSPIQSVFRAAVRARASIAVADDDRAFLRVVDRVRGSRDLSRYDSAAAIIGRAEAARGGEAPWDAALVSIALPDLHGNAVIARLRELFPHLRIWAAIGMEESHSLIGAICAGADGYLIKTCRPDAECATLAALDQDRPPLGRSVAVALLQLAADQPSPAHTPAPDLLQPRLGLSRPQIQLLRRLARGDSVPQAGARLDLAEDGAWQLLRLIYSHLRRAPLCVQVPRALRQQVLAGVQSR